MNERKQTVLPQTTAQLRSRHTDLCRGIESPFNSPVMNQSLFKLKSTDCHDFLICNRTKSPTDVWRAQTSTIRIYGNDGKIVQLVLGHWAFDCSMNLPKCTRQDNSEAKVASWQLHETMNSKSRTEPNWTSNYIACWSVLMAVQPTMRKRGEAVLVGREQERRWIGSKVHRWRRRSVWEEPFSPKLYGTSPTLPFIIILCAGSFRTSKMF